MGLRMLLHFQGVHRMEVAITTLALHLLACKWLRGITLCREIERKRASRKNHEFLDRQDALEESSACGDGEKDEHDLGSGAANPGDCFNDEVHLVLG